MKDEPIQQALFDYDSITALQFKDPISNLQKELSQFGFTPNLSKVYIYLGKYGSKTAFDIVRDLRIPRTEAYNLLKSLMNKGVVYSTMQHPMKFVALPLEKAIWNLVNVEKQRVNNLEKSSEGLVTLWRMIPDFLAQKNSDKDDKFQILKGSHQIRTKVCEIIQNSKDIQILGPERDILGFYHSDAFASLEKSGKRLRLLVSNLTLMGEVAKELKRLRIKKTPNEVGDNLCFVISDGELLFYIRNSNDYPLGAVAFWSNSILLIYSIRMLFDLMWSKP
ncbi:MAG TPA: helix-turn-helix domain-containing protein [Candidatus Nitrosotalea sp.]|nr:helix-turn-helix domain-containing protein [Candidatus Nitrosotalea sp.]